jgi:RIP metalloprotease RseP
VALNAVVGHYDMDDVFGAAGGHMAGDAVGGIGRESRIAVGRRCPRVALEAFGAVVGRAIRGSSPAFSGIIFRTLGGLFTGQTAVSQLQGPVGIAQLSGESADQGFVALLSLMAMLSINLGILNLMPVPVLDGGHILILLLEGVSGRDFSMRFKELMLLAGFVVLMMLMVTVVYNDLTRIQWIEALMPWRN